jgi:hypothetical protein
MGDVDVIEELNAFKMIQITTEVDPGKLWWEIDGEDLNISLESLEKMASAWSLSRVSAWISRNAYPADFVQAFQELRIEKMTFCVLAADTRVLRKRLIQNFEEGRVPSRIRLLTMSGYEQSIDRELARLSQTIKSLMKSKFQEPELGLEIPQVGRQKPIRFKDAMAGNLVSPSTPVRLGVE